jgi:hypothetical protein
VLDLRKGVIAADSLRTEHLNQGIVVSPFQFMSTSATIVINN